MAYRTEIYYRCCHPFRMKSILQDFKHQIYAIRWADMFQSQSVDCSANIMIFLFNKYVRTSIPYPLSPIPYPLSISKMYLFSKRKIFPQFNAGETKILLNLKFYIIRLELCRPSPTEIVCNIYFSSKM